MSVDQNQSSSSINQMALSPEEKKKVINAFRAMKSLGIESDTVKPVLKRLMKLYDGDWKLIEEDNYRTLADAIFEAEEEQEKVEPISKKLHRGAPDQVTLSSLSNGKKIVDLEANGKLRNPSRTKQVESSRALSGNPKHAQNHFSHDAATRNKGKEPIQASSAPSKKNSSSQPESSALHANHEHNETGPCVMKKEIELEDENPYAIMPIEAQPIRALPINQSCELTVPASNTFPGLTSTSHTSEKRKKTDGSGYSYSHQTVIQTTHDIASSNCGQVKLSLTCSQGVGQRNFHHPSADEVMSFMERKYRKFLRTVGATFSIDKLFDEICESYLEMAADPSSGSHINRSPGNFIHQSLGPIVDSTRTYHPERDKGKRVLNTSESSEPRPLQIVQKQPMVYENRRRAVHRVCDISNGTEKVKISLLDEIGNEDLPKYIYTPENIVYQSAYVHVSLARIADDDCCPDCIGDCLSSSIPCACARNTGGEFAYTPDGLLDDRFLKSCISMKRSPLTHQLFYCQDCPLERAKNLYMPETCKGHILRKFIKECWRKCGCSMQCANRVVQRGISQKLEVFLTSEGKGWGLRTLEELPKGAFVCEYAGEILTNIELYERNKKRPGKDKHVYPVLLDADWATEEVLKDEDALCLDATYYGNVARFINHRCFDGNLIEVPVQVESPDRHYYHLAFFTSRKVEAKEELTWDYGIDFDDQSHPIEAFICNCGSLYCRDKRGRNH